MADVSIHWRIEGANRVDNQLRRAAREFPEVLDKEIGDFTTERAEFLRGKPYPPPPLDSTYVRTGYLGESWLAHKIRDAVWELVNLAEYAGWVVDEHLQAWMHVGRWWIFQDEVRPAPELTDKLTKALNKVWK